MRDMALLTATLQTIRDDGGGTAHLLGCGQTGGWRAGGACLNDQAVRDLIDDGWLRRDSDARCARLDAWPSFAAREEQHG
jgi:hypothetical protein